MPQPVEPVAAPEPVAESLDVRLREALDALDVGVVVGDRSGAVVFRSRTAAGLTGAAHADVLVEEAVQRHLADSTRGRSGRQVLDLLGPPRAVVVVTGSPLSGGALVTIEDVTERSRLDAVKTDFVANVSHELKTPVGAIAVLAEALVDETDPAVIHRFGEKMMAEAHRVGRTIDDLLELSRIELGGEPVSQLVDMRAVVDEAVERVADPAGARGITVRCEGVEGTVHGDVRQLVSAVGNLVENAVKYSEDGTTVFVTCTTADGWVDLSVVDTGVGIPAKDLDRIFERFYRVDRARSRGTGGTGLGLSIVRHIASNHGGDVSVTSREGEGSTFTLRIPVTGATSREAGA